MNVEKISAITIKVNDMASLVHFYNRRIARRVELLLGPDFVDRPHRGSGEVHLRIGRGS